MEISTAQALIPEPRLFEVEFAIAELKKDKSPINYQISA
jgi:hypothetical protein